MNDILDIIGNHCYIDDMAGTSTPVQIRSRPGEVSICEADTKIISFFSPSSQKLLRTILKNMKLPTMMKRYFDAYTLYVGQNTLQIFANFEDDPPITSSRISSVTSSTTSSKDEEEDSDADSGVGRASPIQQDIPESNDKTEDQDDIFTILWYGTDDTEESQDISKIKGIFPDIQIEDHSDEDPDDISEEEIEDTPSYYIAESNGEDGQIFTGPTTDSEDEEEGIFPDLPTSTYQIGDEDDIVEEEDNEDEILAGLIVSNCQSLAASAPTSATSPPEPIESFEYKDHIYDTVTNEDEEDDIMSRITVTNLESAGNDDRVTSFCIDTLCHALSNISINQSNHNGEYVEEEDDTKTKKVEEKPIIRANCFPPPVPKPRTKSKLSANQVTKSGQCLVDTGALRSINLATGHKPKIEISKDPLLDPAPVKKTTELNPEQTHNILKPYYRTIDEPWDQHTANDPRITLAAMFKANSTKYREDSIQRQCSRPACQYKTDCYWEREWEQRQGRGMYNYTQCI